MTNSQNLLGNRTKSATATRTSVVLVLAGIVLAIIGALTSLWGLAIVGGIMLALGVIFGIVGVIGSGLSR